MRPTTARLVSTTAAACALAACATMRVSSHVERGLDFTRYRTFDWGPAEALPAGDARLDEGPYFEDQGIAEMFVRLPAAQGSRREPPPLALHSLTGKDSFDRYCATCHGVTGRGGGALAPSLRSAPTDLTMLAQRNGGTFPRAQVSASVEGTGRELPAHGPTQMPLWGGIFRWLDSEARARVRINNLVAYVESLQAAPPPTAAPTTGRELFETFCAPCHGGSASGDGPMAAQLTRQPPDLRKLQIRNRGQFPGSRVERIIDGRQIDAHGTRSMPVWGDVFFREPGVSHADVDARIDAIIEYIRSIQERPV